MEAGAAAYMDAGAPAYIEVIAGAATIEVAPLIVYDMM